MFWRARAGQRVDGVNQGGVEYLGLVLEEPLLVGEDLLLLLLHGDWEVRVLLHVVLVHGIIRGFSLFWDGRLEMVTQIIKLI